MKKTYVLLFLVVAFILGGCGATQSYVRTETHCEWGTRNGKALDNNCLTNHNEVKSNEPSGQGLYIDGFYVGRRNHIGGFVGNGNVVGGGIGYCGTNQLGVPVRCNRNLLWWR